MNALKKIIVILVISIMVAPSLSYAEKISQEEFNQVNSTQAITKQSPEELKRTHEKEKDAQELINAISSYENSNLSKKELENKLKQFREKYNPSSQIKNQMQSEEAIIKATRTSSCLSFSCSKQQKNWYCGPASAYNILHGRGISSHPYDGRSLTQNNLASDLGAQSSGAPWTGTWTSTLNTWANTFYYVASNGPSASDLFNFARCDTYDGFGSIYDTYMSGSNQLYGYAVGSTRYHYVAGDGYNTSNSTVHYLDSNNQNQTAFGTHWISATTMANCTASRGMVW